MKRIEGQPKSGTAEYQRMYRKRRPEVGREAQRRWRMKSIYGTTVEDYDAMFEQQGGVCGICHHPQESKKLAVDHCHETGKVRGLLCENCNTGLGKFKDDPALLDAAKEWLG